MHFGSDVGDFQTLAPHAVFDIRDERWQLQLARPFDGCSIVEMLGVDSQNRGERGTFVLPFEPWVPLPTRTRARTVSMRGWRRLARRVVATATPSPCSLRCAPRLRFDPLPFQLEPVLSYLRGDASRFLIADAVGLGKTLQAGLAIAEMLERHREGRALIVAPAGLREQWRRELKERLGLDAAILDAEGLWHAMSQLPAGVNPWSVPRTVITSTDFVKRPEVLRSLEPLVWDIVVFDEAHTLSGRSDRHIAASGLSRRARAVILLTATPHDGNDEAFERLRALGDLDGRFPLTVFSRSRRDLGLPHRRRSFILGVRPSTQDHRLQAALVRYARLVWATSGPDARLAMLVLLKRGASGPAALARSLARRRQLLALDARLETHSQMTLPLADDDDGEPAGELGAQGLVNRDEELAVLDELIALATEASTRTAKVDAMTRLLRRVHEPTLVFTQYRDTLEELRGLFYRHMPVSIHGDMSLRERQQAAIAFTQGTARLLLATDAASEGLNLHARCRLVVNFDLPWTPLRLEQRAGRVDRLGQTKPVHVWQLVAAGTYEEIVAERVRARAAAALAATGGLRRDDERETAAAILAEAAPVETPESAPSARTDSGSEHAIAEAERVRRARAWLRHASVAAPGFPFVARPRSGATQLLIAYQLNAADPSRRHTWDCLVGIFLTIGHSQDLERMTSLTDEPNLVKRVQDSQSERWAQQVQTWRRAASTILRRDRAIRRSLRAERARLAAALSQPRLFYDRPPHGDDSQLHVLDESLSRLRSASEEVRAVARVAHTGVTLRFAIALRPHA